MPASPHVAVIGAGTLGLCTALALTQGGARVTVIEANAVGSGSSGRSVGVVGTQFTDSFDLLLRSHSLPRFRHWESLGLRFNHIGYLRLARTEAQMALFEQTLPLRIQAGFRSVLCSPEDLRRLVPHMDTDGLAGGSFGPDDGFLDPHEFCTLLADQIRAAGGEIRQQCRLEGVTRRLGSHRLETTKGPVDCDIAVNAAGAWAARVATLFSQTMDLLPERHEAVRIHLDRPLDYIMPMVMDLLNGEGTGLNFRHDRPGEMIAEIHKVDPAPPADPDAYNELCEETSKEHLAELLLQRLPDLPGARLGRGWAGLYPASPDHRPLIGPVDPAEPTLVTAAGAGGYGIQLAPVIGQLAADWALYGGPISVPGTEALRPGAERVQAAALF